MKLCDHSGCTEVFRPAPLPSQQSSHHQRGLLRSQDFQTSDLDVCFQEGVFLDLSSQDFDDYFQKGVFVGFGFPHECQYLFQVAQRLQAPKK